MKRLEAQRSLFGKYEIIKPLGAGGMGEILLARQIGLPGIERLVVIKKVLKHLGQDREFLERFLLEMRIASALSHGNIVQVYEVGEVKGEYFMAMEYIEGMDLREAINRLKEEKRAFPQEIAVHILIEVCKALSYAHNRCDSSGKPLMIVHRDVSPANILLSVDGQVKITDFGVAKVAQKTYLTQPGTLHGKLCYISPEQASSGICDHRADIFSLGVVGYEMLTGRRPFDGESDLEVLDKIRVCKFQQLDDISPTIHASISKAITKALSKDPNDRFQTADEFCQALSNYFIENQTVVSTKDVQRFVQSLMEQPEEKHGSIDGIAFSNLEISVPPVEEGRTVSVRISPQHAKERRYFRWQWLLLLVPVFIFAVWFGILDSFGDNDTGFVENDDVYSFDTIVDATEVHDEKEVEIINDVSQDLEDMAIAIKTVQSIVVNSNPKGAMVFLKNKKLGVTPLEIPIPKNNNLRLIVRMDGYEEKSIYITPTTTSNIYISLTKIPTGKVRFRFFPANARVTIDNKAIFPSSNIVDMIIEQGSHILRIEAAGKVKEVSFKVNPDEVTELGTIEPDR